jgi:D-alanine-D-alanine ligase
MQQLDNRVAGPLHDLASHVPAEWWRTLFGPLYLRTDGDVVENDRITAQEVDVLVAAAALSEHHRILDLCCGQGRHALELARRGFAHVTGLDHSSFLVQLARRRAAAAALPVAFREGDARQGLPECGPFDRIYVMGNSFGYFDDVADDRALLEEARRALAPGGTLTLDIVDGSWLGAHLDRLRWEWIDDQHLVCRERELSGDGDRVVTRELVVHITGGIVADQLYAERLYSRDRICALLADAGFDRIAFHSNLKIGNGEHRDPGLMANRVLLTASVSPARPAGIVVRRSAVMVLLGDPRRPDGVKRDGRFNAEDIDTVVRLQSALASIESYAFYYVDDHDELVERLACERPRLVFNLCDEGFQNRPEMELHVPALLEMRGLAYTGSPPACLAVCYDKSLVRAQALALSIPVPDEIRLRHDDAAPPEPLAHPLFVKPARADGSFGIGAWSLADDRPALLAAIDRLSSRHAVRDILVQQFLDGPEYSLGIIGNVGSRLRVLPILEVDYSALSNGPRIQCYESKWDPASGSWTGLRCRKAQIGAAEARHMEDAAVALFRALGCRDYARFDFRAGADGVIRLLEVNPNSSWCWDGKMAVMAEIGGMSYPDLLQAILDCAWQRLHQ